jgi:hypothetical protein
VNVIDHTNIHGRSPPCVSVGVSLLGDLVRIHEDDLQALIDTARTQKN